MHRRADDEVQTKGAVKSGSFRQISRFQTRDVKS